LSDEQNDFADLADEYFSIAERVRQIEKNANEKIQAAGWLN